jgi:CSLREA domain-containing protein
MGNTMNVFRHLAMVLLSCAGMACAPDRVFTVNTTQDLHDIDPGDGICGANRRGDQCSLRAAVEEANQSIESLRVLISVPAGVYALTLGEPDGLQLTRGLVHVRGAAQTTTIVDGLGTSRIFTLNAPSLRQIIFENMQLRNGRAPGEDDSGGAVFINSPDALVTFTGMTIRDSVADFLGGGIYAVGNGTLNIINSTIQANQSTEMGTACDFGGGLSGGGGIYADLSNVTIFQSEIRDNCGSSGGGVRLSRGNVLVLRSTIAGNRAPTRGGGILIQNADARIEDSTIALNTTTAAEVPTAAGLHIIDSTLALISVTIAANENSFDVIGGAGGILVENTSVNTRNTVIADNNIFGLRDCAGEIGSSGGNFIGAANEECDIAEQASDILDGGAPGLGTLTNNGGPTRTMRPTSNSPLVDNGIGGCEPIDQRGFGFPAPLGGACDIGAVER